jgi:hypothetical protein
LDEAAYEPLGGVVEKPSLAAQELLGHLLGIHKGLVHCAVHPRVEARPRRRQGSSNRDAMANDALEGDPPLGMDVLHGAMGIEIGRELPGVPLAPRVPPTGKRPG